MLDGDARGGMYPLDPFVQRFIVSPPIRASDLERSWVVQHGIISLASALYDDKTDM